MMSCEKNLNEEQLQNVTGGTNGTAEPVETSATNNESSSESNNESNPFADVPYTPDKKIPNTDRVSMH